MRKQSTFTMLTGRRTDLGVCLRMDRRSTELGACLRMDRQSRITVDYNTIAQ